MAVGAGLSAVGIGHEQMSEKEQMTTEKLMLQDHIIYNNGDSR